MTDILSLIAEKVNPAEKDAFTALEYVPHDRQKVFHDLSRQRIDAILFGGAAGGGKSCALLMEAIHHAVNTPGMNIICLRRTFPELDKSFLAELKRRAYARALGGRWNGTERTLKFPNMSQITFTYAENEQDASRLQGGEFQLIAIDEAQLMPPVVVQRVEERLRSGNRALPVIGLRLSANPGDIGGYYLKERFVDPTEDGTLTYVDGQGRSTAFIQSTVDDNPHVGDYKQRVLEQIADPVRRKQMLEGDWSVISGMFFEQWSRARHVVPRFEIHKDWQRYCGIDWGFRDPWGVVWGAVDLDGRLFLYREIYLTGVDVPYQAQLILEAEANAKEKDVVRVADPSMWGKHGTPLSIADVYGMNGCGISQADNDRINGWARVHYFLNDDKACPIHAEMGWETCPRLHVLEGTCPVLVKQIPELPRDKHKPDDADTHAEDHIADALRYMCMAVGTSARPIIYDDNPRDELNRIYREQVEQALPAGPQPLVAGRFAGNLSSGLSGY